VQIALFPHTQLVPGAYRRRAKSGANRDPSIHQGELYRNPRILLQDYDYRNPTLELSEQEQLNQLLWDEQASGESLREGMRMSTVLYDAAKQYLASDDGVWLVCDMAAYKAAK
jgi:hypothetical protein